MSVEVLEMLIENTEINEVKVISPQIHNDSRGYFFESYSFKSFKENGLPSSFVQDNEVLSDKKGVLRGLHYQLEFPQGKIVRAIIGSILDVAVDIRVGSPTYGKYVMVELSSENKKMLYIPEGFAHGYLVLSEKSLVSYKCTNLYNPNDEYGIRWDDKSIGINWNYNSPMISKKDDDLPLLKDQRSLPNY